MKRLLAVTIFAAIIITSVLNSSSAEEEKPLFTPCQYKASYNYYMSRGDQYMADSQLESAMESFQRALIIQPNSDEARRKIIMIKETLRAREEPRTEQVRKKAIAQAMRYAEEERPQPQLIVEPEKPKPAKEEPARISYKPKISEPRPQIKQKPSQAYPEPEAKKDSGLLPELFKQGKKEVKPEAIEQQPEKIELAQKYPTAPAEKKIKVSTAAPGEPSPAAFDFDLVKFNNGINDKIQEGGDNLNSGIAPNKVKGEYRLCFGATEDDFIWKDANADYHNMPGDTSWRYIFGQDKYNSYDKQIYSKLRVEIDSPITSKLDFYNDVVIDPWTFVGKKRVYVTAPNRDNVQMDLKYWSNVRRTINETYRTEHGDIVNIQENKVVDGKTSPETYRGLSDWGSQRFPVPEVEIDRMYVPLRKSWFEYESEPYHAKAFFMADQSEALTSDDPMRLSNNKVWWEESPWLDTYEPSRVFDRAGVSWSSTYNRTREPTKKGQWVRSQSYVARDSEDTRLTFLRGVSMDADYDRGLSLKMVAAAPRNLWDTYEQATSLPAAIRVKSPITDKFDIGGLYTLKTGFRHDSIEAVNNLLAIDGSYQLFPNTELLAEGSISHMDTDEAIGYDNTYTGYAALIGLKNQGPLKFTEDDKDRYEFEASIAHMDDNFFPGLSNYRFTRKEFDFAKHIYFDEMNPENEACMIGDGMDVGRNSIRARAKAELPSANTDAQFDFRTVHDDGGNFIENVFRAEATNKPTEKLTIKALGYYQHLGKSHKGIDPLINAKSSYTAFTDYFAYDDVWLENSVIPAGKDPSIGSFSGGLEYEFTDYLTGIGIYEATNDPKDWPRGLLNNVYVTDYYENGVIWDKVVPFLYDQGSFGIPPYEYYNIFKTQWIYTPFDPIKVTLNYIYNQNKYAMAIEDFPTSQGIEVEYKPSDRLTLGFLYQYTRQRDPYKEFVAKQGYNFDGHHNIFAALDYKLNEDQNLRIMYGDYIGYDYIYPEEHGDIQALDTRHIIRVAYTGSWGGAREPRRESAAASGIKPLGNLKPDIPGAKFVTNLYGGWMKYQERAEIAPVESEWDDYFGKIEFGLDAYDKERVEGSLRLGLFVTTKDQEQWDYDNTGVYQTDDMDFRGADVNFNIGWAIADSSKYISFTPLINAGYRRIEFSRSNIGRPSSRAISQLGEVDEHFNVSFLGIGGKVDLALIESINIYGSGYWAPIVYTPTKNETLGSLDSNQGVIWHAEGGCDYALSDRFELGLGAFWDLQNIDRAQRIDNGIVSAELPDNKLTSIGLKLGGLYKF